MAVRRVLSWLLSLTTTGTGSPVLLVRIDDGTKAGRLYRHLNVGEAQHVEREGASFLVLTDYYGHRLAEYRTDLVRYSRARTSRSLDQLRACRVVRT